MAAKDRRTITSNLTFEQARDIRDALTNSFGTMADIQAGSFGVGHNYVNAPATTHHEIFSMMVSYASGYAQGVYDATNVSKD